MMNRKKTYYLLVLLFAFADLPAQDIHFSQFFQTPLLRNPALAGLFDGDIRVQGVYRDQWNSVTQAYRTGSLNAEYKIPVNRLNDFMTVGLQTFFDRAGSISYSNTQLLPAINFHKSLSTEKTMYITAGFMGGWVQHRIDLSKVTTNSVYDGMGINENITEPSYSYLDGSAGLSMNASLKGNPENSYYLGAAFHHFNRPKTSFYRNKEIELNPKWVFSGGLKLGVGEYGYVTIQADHSRQGSFRKTVFGGLYALKIGALPETPDYILHFGTYMRLNDALIPVIKLDYLPFSLCMSYDANISKLKPSSSGRGGFELSVSFIKKLERNRESENSPF